MASNSNWIKPNQDNIDKTPPSSSVKRSRSRLSRKNLNTSQINKDVFWSPTNKLSTTTPKRITNKSITSPSTPKHDWFLSQDPSREIIWDYRPLSPLNKFVTVNNNNKEDLMTNLCKTWKQDGKAASPLGSDALLKQWTKPKEIPDKIVQTIRPTRLIKETTETSRTLDPHKAVDRFTKELRRINKMILQSKSIDETVIDEHHPSRISSKSLIISKDKETLNEVILAPDSCEDSDSDDNLWGNADDSFNRQLLQVELCVTNSVIPSTLSSDEEEKIELAPFKDIVNITTNMRVTKTLSEENMEKVSKEPEIIDDFSDLFNDDDDNDDNFCLSQEVLSIMDQKTVDVFPSTLSSEEPSCSQKRRATAADIARKRDEALKRRESKIKKSNSFDCVNINKPFIRTFSDNSC